MYKILDLFSGLGGFSLGLERTGCFKTIAFCDNDKFSKLILDKHWKGVKIYDNVKEISKERFIADGIQFPDIITGGFPCQPFSVAGKQKGTSDDRHLWPEMFRIIKAFKPRYVIGENVRGIINIQDGVVFETVCTDLESEGYEVQPFIIPAAGVGAPHRRERVWIVAIREESMVNSDNVRFEQHNTAEEEAFRRRSSTTFEPTSDVVNSEHNGSFTSTIEGSSAASSNDNEKGQNETSEFEGTSGSRDSKDVANSRRTLRSRGELGAADEDETRKENADQLERSSSASETNVADTDSRLRGGGRTIEPSREDEDRFLHSEEEKQTREHLRSKTIGRSFIRGETADVADTNTRLGNGENEEIQTGRNTSNTSSEKLANTDSERLEGQRQSSRQFSQKFFTSDSSEGQQGTMDQGWWSVEPDVGRVAHGVSGRVHRLKALGNSIVPQIAEEIGRAIIKAEKKGGHYE